MSIGTAVAKRATRSHDEGAGKLAAILVSPTMAVLGLVVLYPIIAALYTSLFVKNTGVNPKTGIVEQGDKFVGLQNYTAIFSGDTASTFWTAFGNTTFFTVINVIIETAIGVAMALVMHRAFRGRGVVRASILVPWAIPTAVSALLWRWIFQPQGVANAVLNAQVLWTADGTPAKYAVIIADTWKTAPFIGLLVLAGLQTIPNEVYEAAKVDGAGGWTQLFRITLPLAKPALLVAVLFRILDTLRIFDLPYVLIGKHKDSVNTLAMLAQDEATNVRYGPAAAYSTVLFIYVAIVAFLFVKILGADVIGAARSQRKTAPRGRHARKPEVAAA